MTVTLSAWMLPVALTVLVWVGVALWPVRSSGGSYDFGGAFDALLHGVCGIIATLVIWLVYFMWLSAQ